jgi:hypothetical protein
MTSRPTSFGFRPCPPVAGAALLLACAGAASAQYADQAVARGVDYFVAAGAQGRGAAWADLDNDGDVDLVAVGAATGQIGIWENDGAGNFTSRAATAGLGTIIPSSAASGVCAADYDADGDLDLFFCIGGGIANVPDRLFRNNGDWTFTNVTSAAGVGNIGSGMHASWGDIDNDGDLDLHVANYDASTPDALYRNNANGTFTNIAAALGIADRKLTFQSCLFDYDNDGDLDLYLSNDRGWACPTCGNYLFRNDGAVFTDVSASAGALIQMNSMGTAIGDFDGNGHIDVYSTNTVEGNKLLLNTGAATFVESAVPSGTASFATGWGALFFDCDNNARNDLYVCNMDSIAPNRLYVHSGQWPCTNVAAAMGVADNGVSFCAAYADIDNDGDLDIVLSNYDEPLHVYVNDGAPDLSWAMFRVVGTGRNLWGLGARVRVTAGGLTQVRDVMAGSDAFKSQNDLRVHFGLNAAPAMDQIQATWPGGASRTLTGYAARRHWTLYPDARLGDANADGQVTFADFPALVAAYSPKPGSLTPGHELFDFDADADVDDVDIDLFFARYSGDVLDCNADGQSDLAQIARGELADANADGVPDVCQCEADFNHDATVNSTDVSDFINQWFQDQVDATLVTDWDLNGIVNSTDVSEYISAFFEPCP